MSYRVNSSIKYVQELHKIEQINSFNLLVIFLRKSETIELLMGLSILLILLCLQFLCLNADPEIFF